MDPQSLFNIAAGALLTIGGWFAHQMWEAMTDMRKDIHQLEVDLPSHYVQKDEFRQAFHEIKDMLAKVIDKLDGKADK